MQVSLNYMETPEMFGKQNTDLLIRLGHELASALQIYEFDEQFLRELWPEAYEALVELSQHLTLNGLPIPEVIEDVLMRFAPKWKPKS